MLYSSIDNQKIKDIKKLNQKKYRDQSNLFLVEGEHLVLEAYKNNYLENIIILEGTNFNLEKNNIYVTDKVMKYLSELDNYPTVMGICKKINNHSVGNKILVLDNIQDPGNLGTIIRSAVAFNFDSIFLSLDTVDLYNSKVIRASQGLIFNINIDTCDIVDKIKQLKALDYKIIGTKVDNGIDVSTVDKQDKLVLIMGNEGSGMSDEVSSLCDVYAHIKMNESCESLNVGVACSIMMYELNM